MPYRLLRVVNDSLPTGGHAHVHSRASLGLSGRWLALTLALLLLAIGPAAALASPSHQGGGYVVQRGDTLAEIAARFGVSVNSLAQVNGITDANLVYVGQQLIIPGVSSGADASGTAETASALTETNGEVHVVQSGETLARIAARYGVSLSSLASANGITNYNKIITGQRLVIPGAGSTAATTEPAPTTGTSTASTGIHVVQAGETLASISRQHGTTVNALVAANGLANANYIWVGQRLKLSGGASGGSSSSTSTGASAGRWIDIDLSQQRLTAFQGDTAVFSVLMSAGLPNTPTVTGQFKIQTKLVSTRMRGPGYDLPNVPYTMYFYRGYGIHGTYWHNNFGHPMSHGCVNLRTADAAWLFDWASIGTPVVSHW